MAEWLHQVRVYGSETSAERGASETALRPVRDALARRGATLVSQLDAFQDYVDEAERAGPDGFPLYKWTKATLSDPEKRAKHGRAFAVRLAGAEVYSAAAADALEAELRPFVGGAVERLSRHDTNPAGNLPVPEEFRT